MTRNRRKEVVEEQQGIALYHVVYKNEGFDEAANAIFEIIRHAQHKFPGKPRLLFLDIQDHRNEEGGFDADMFELQRDFLIGSMAPYLTEISCPLARVRNSKRQQDDVPGALRIEKEG